MIKGEPFDSDENVDPPTLQLSKRKSKKTRTIKYELIGSDDDDALFIEQEEEGANKKVAKTLEVHSRFFIDCTCIFLYISRYFFLLYFTNFVSLIL